VVTVVTKTIGPTGRDYTTFTLAEAAVESIATAEFGGTDLVANDGAIVFEADAGTYNEIVTWSSSLTTDATRQVTYKPAAGSEHGGVLGSGPYISGAYVNVVDSFTKLEGLSAKQISLSAAAGARAVSCVSGGEAYPGFNGNPGGTVSSPNVIENCVAVTVSGVVYGIAANSSSGTAQNIRVTNSTIVGSAGRGVSLTADAAQDVNATLDNVLVLTTASVTYIELGAGTVNATGSNNFGGGSNPFPAALQGSPYPITATTSFSTPLGSGDFAVYMGATGALADKPGNDVWQQGVGPGTNSDVPTTDINGVARSGATANPGAFEADGFVAPTVTTQTIGPVGRDYATFTLAEASLPSEDITFTNRAFVFEADAATYSEYVTISSSLVTDATRQVTYKPAAGSEHGGVPGQGVRIQFGNLSLSSWCIAANDPFTAVKGLEFDWTDSGSTGRPAETQNNIEGVTFSDCIIRHAGTGVMFLSAQVNISDTQSFPVQVSNCVLDGSNAAGFRLWNYGASDKAWTVTNCTIKCSGRAFDIFSHTTDTTCTITNNLILSAAEDWRDQGGGGTSTVLGSNNFGPQTSATHVFPAALKGSPYPITATTSFSTPLGAGDYAVYMGATGALADKPGNDVWQQGVGPGTNSDVPTTDINGVARSGASCNPGAFEADGFVAPTVITRTIDASGAGDYTTFSLALADLANVAGGSDLTLLNRAVAFEAVAGNYAGNVNVDSTSFDFDPTRNLTLRPQDGSEHGGDRTAGVIVAGGTSYAFRAPCDFLRLEGFVCTFTGNYGVSLLGSAPGVILDSLIVDDLNSATMAIRNDNAGATADFPVVIQNCVVFVQGSRGIGFFGSGTYHARVTNCTVVHSALEWCYINYNPSATLEFTNNVALTSGSTFRDNSGTATITGSNNFGGSGAPWPVALQGSPYPITATTSFSTPLGAGDFAVYMGATGALADKPGNDVWQQGVGPGTNSDVPTTDINGVARSGATCNPGAFEADGFVAPTVTTQTIGPVGRDFATFTLAEASLPSEDITFTNRAFVFEADAAVYNESAQVNFISSLTTDPTRNVTYKPAAGSEHGGSESAGVRIVSTAYTAVNVRDDNTAFVGLVIANASSFYAHNVVGFGGMNIQGQRLTNCIIACSDSNVGYGVQCYRNSGNGFLGTASNPVTVSSCVFLRVGIHAVPLGSPGSGATIADNLVFSNCTFLSKSAAAGGGTQAFGVFDTSGTLNIKVVNCLNVGVANDFNQSTSTLTVTTTGSAGNFGVQSSASWQFPGKGSPYPITATTSFSTPLGAGDYAVYMGATGALANVTGNDVWQQGVGPGTNSDVPTTDINGVARSGASCNPGAFEADGFVAPTITTQTIGPVGRDFATFTLAEASLPAEDITFTNRAFVFEADAATYSESVSFSSSLTTDATRNVTYRPASGSEHGGSLSAGVIVSGSSGNAAGLYDDFIHFEGIVVKSSASYAIAIGADGVTVDGLLLANTNAHVAIFQNGTALNPVRCLNCVAHATNGNGFYIFAPSTAAHVHLVNSTAVVSSGSYAIRAYGSAANLTLINHLGLVTSGAAYQAVASPTISGSNNFSISAGALPVAVQGSPYPITATTSFSTPLGAGDYAVYMGATGALADKPGNDVWQQGVGPGSNASVPTTDINGVARSGASCNPGAFEADGFVAPTITTQTIGPVGRDFATFTLAEASLPSEDITFTNRAFVFEADAATYDSTASAVYFQSSLTTDPTRNVTYKPTEGAEHGGSLSGVPRIDAATGVMDDFTTLDGLVLYAQSGGDHSIFNSAVGVVYRGCVAANPTGNTTWGINAGGTAQHPVTWENCIVYGQQVGFTQRAWQLATYSGDTYARLVNCTTVADGNWSFFVGGSTANTLEAEVVNHLSLGESTVWAGNYTDPARNITGSNNFGGSGGPFPVALQGSPYPITASTAYDPGAGDFALYVGKNGALLDSPNNDVINGGVGPAANADVPTTDILGDTRSGTTTNPGAFALAQATAVLTRTIGPVGRDYATFIEAEADVENIGGSADLVFENERIEFVVDSATYSGLVVMSDGLTKDPTRNVTYRAAVPHGGVFGSGPILTSTTTACVYASEDYITFRDLQFQASGPSGLRFQTAGTVGNLIQNCLWDGSSTSGAILGVFIFSPFGSGTSANPHIVENCVARGSFNISADSADSHFRIRNCTNIYHPDLAGDINQRQFILYTNTGRTNSLQVLNCWTAFSRPFSSSGSGTATVTGSNNFSPNTGGGTDLPAAIQGSPYPITATTNTDPGPGHFAIYEAATGALIVVDDNAALGGGVGPAANADVPVFDINGVKRIGGGCDPGAFEGVRSRSTDVWDVMYGSHNIPGTFGKLVQDIPEAVPSAEEIATAVWNKLIADHQGAGSFGELSQQTKLAADRAGTQRLQ
jgi:hypothetical protein